MEISCYFTHFIDEKHHCCKPESIGIEDMLSEGKKHRNFMETSNLSTLSGPLHANAWRNLYHLSSERVYQR